MFKLIIATFATILAVASAAAKPGIVSPLAYSSPLVAGGPVVSAYGALPGVAGYGAPVVSAYGAPGVVSAYGAPGVVSAYGAPVVSAYSAPYVGAGPLAYSAHRPVAYLG